VSDFPAKDHRWSADEQAAFFAQHGFAFGKCSLCSPLLRHITHDQHISVLPSATVAQDGRAHIEHLFVVLDAKQLFDQNVRHEMRQLGDML
jgi:hypothetical protein